MLNNVKQDVTFEALSIYYLFFLYHLNEVNIVCY